MTFTPDFCKTAIYIDESDDYYLGSEQINLTYPVRFATVSLQLHSTNPLDEIIDAIREQQGCLPLFPTDLHPDDYDDNGWYNFYISLNSNSPTRVDTCITAYVESNFADDDGQEYHIDLDEEEQRSIYARLDEQAREIYGKSCAELLAESEAELRELIDCQNGNV